MPEKMRAMVLSKLGPVESNPLKLTEIDRQEIANPKEVLVKIEACGVCHSQLHSIEGDWEDIGIPPTLPTVPGHEVVGKIVEIGNDVTKFKVDERVGITPCLVPAWIVSTVMMARSIFVKRWMSPENL